MIVSFDPGPLLRLADRLVIDRRRLVPANVDSETSSDGEVADLLGVTRRQVVRWRAGTRIPWYEADRLAVELGLHLEIVWQEAAAWCPHPKDRSVRECGCAA